MKTKQTVEEKKNFGNQKKKKKWSAGMLDRHLSTKFGVNLLEGCEKNCSTDGQRWIDDNGQ